MSNVCDKSHQELPMPSFHLGVCQELLRSGFCFSSFTNAKFF